MLDRLFSFGGLLRHVRRITFGVVRDKITRHVGPLPGLPGRGARQAVSITTTRRPAPEPGGAGDVEAHEELPAVDRVLSNLCCVSRRVDGVCPLALPRRLGVFWCRECLALVRRVDARRLTTACACTALIGNTYQSDRRNCVSWPGSTRPSDTRSYVLSPYNTRP